MISGYPKRLIEVDLPIARISAHARREKAIRLGHISTLHIWWARRPLAACRAVILASLWPDPVDLTEWAREGDEVVAPRGCKPEQGIVVRPGRFLAEVRLRMASWAHIGLGKVSAESGSRLVAIQKNHKALDDPAELRAVLLDFIADFANWDNSTDRDYLETGRALTQAAHEALGGVTGTKPLVVDPFAGGGSIPLEALRVGADAFASDLNPVAVLLNKVVLEYVPRYGQRLANGVRKSGELIKREAEKEIAAFYVKDLDGATPIAYLWARTILSEAPTTDRIPVQIPLLRSLWLSKRPGFLRALRWARDAKGVVKTELVSVRKGSETIRVRCPLLEVFTPTRKDQVEAGTVKGGAATCPVTGFTTKANRVKGQLIAQRGGAGNSRLYAVYVENRAGREFRLAGDRDQLIYQGGVAAARQARKENSDAFPDEVINPIRPYKNTRGLSAVTRIGCSAFSDLYNPRQALSIYTFYEAVKRLNPSRLGVDRALAEAIQTVLAFAVNRAVSQNTSISRWDATRLTIKGAYSKQALAVVWDFAEANPFSGASADWDGAIEWVIKCIEANVVLGTAATVVRSSATKIPLPSDSATALVTDPPYFAAIPYADLSDFFYVWLKRGLKHIHPDLLGSPMTNKDEELIVTNAEKGTAGRAKDDGFFREGMTDALTSARDVVEPSGIGVVVYAEGTTAGWEAIIGAIIDAGWTVTSSWPIDTEMQNRTQAQGSASLQSSIHIVCRPREDANGLVSDEGVGDWREILRELPRRISEWLPRLAKEGVVGADAIFACLGPALEVFSRYGRVERASGDGVGFKEYLEQVWAAVAKEALTMIFSDADTAGFEEDARLTAMWLWTLSAGVPTAPNEEDTETEEPDDESEGDGKKAKLGGFVLEYDAARKIAQGLGVHMEDLSSLVEVSGETARLLPVKERTRYLFGKETEQSSKAKTARKKKARQGSLFEELEALESADSVTPDVVQATPGTTVLDRVHQAMILFAAQRGEALKRFLVDDGVGKDTRVWRLADALAALYPRGTDERRWVEGVLARKKGLGF